MAITDVQQTAIQIVNRVQRKIGVDQTTGLGGTRHSHVLLDLLNEVVSDLGDLGDWQEMFREIDTTAVSSVADYEINVTAAVVVHHVHEIRYDTSTSPMFVRSIEDIRRLDRPRRYGESRHFAIVGQGTAGNPKFRVSPVPTSAIQYHVAFYEKPVIYTTADSSTRIPFPGDVLFQGVYAKALLEESEGVETPQYVGAYREYERMKRQALARQTSDTGTDINLVPG